MSSGTCNGCTEESEDVRCRGDTDCKARYCSEACRDKDELVHCTYEKVCGEIIGKEKEKAGLTKISLSSFPMDLWVNAPSTDPSEKEE